MSYNPVRAAAGFRQNRRKPQDPHSGIKHSDIVKRGGIGITAPMNVGKVNTNTGFSSNIFAGEGFVVRHESVYAGSSVGFGVNDTGDRVIHVLRGSLFAVVESNGSTINQQIHVGGHILAPRGYKHGYATSGTLDCEILIIETPKYFDGWVSLTPGVVSNNAPTHSVPTETAAPLRERDNSQAKLQAEMSARSKGKRRPKTVSEAANNINSANQLGVNPRPGNFPTDD